MIKIFGLLLAIFALVYVGAILDAAIERAGTHIVEARHGD